MFAGRQGLIAADIQDENYLQRQYDLQHTERQATAACMAFSWRPAARNCSTKLRMALSAAGDCRLPLSAAARQPLVSSLPFFLSFFPLSYSIPSSLSPRQILILYRKMLSITTDHSAVVTSRSGSEIKCFAAETCKAAKNRLDYHENTAEMLAIRDETDANF